MPVLFFLGILLQLTAKGATTEVLTSIHDIDVGQPREDTLVLLENGLVAKFRSSRGATLGNEVMYLKNKTVRLKLDENRFITEVTLTNDASLKYNDVPGTLLEEEFEATPIRSYTLASRYFRGSRYNRKASECFNRSMVWSYEWWKKYKIKSNKLFIFFSRAYIRKYNYKWWFHTAPMVKVRINGKLTERMMDRKFTKQPMSVRGWTNTFMRNNARCKPITKYSEYADFPYTGWCFIQKTHMYTYQPADLQMYEAWGYSKDHFEMREVAGAYLEAFNLRIREN